MAERVGRPKHLPPTATRFRRHRGGLAESMATICPCSNMNELLTIVHNDLDPWGVDITADKITVEPYTYDERIEWDTYIVCVEGYGPVGWTDGPIE